MCLWSPSLLRRSTSAQTSKWWVSLHLPSLFNKSFILQCSLKRFWLFYDISLTPATNQEVINPTCSLRTTKLWRLTSTKGYVLHSHHVQQLISTSIKAFHGMDLVFIVCSVCVHVCNRESSWAASSAQQRSTYGRLGFLQPVRAPPWQEHTLDSLSWRSVNGEWATYTYIQDKSLSFTWNYSWHL